VERKAPIERGDAAEGFSHGVAALVPAMLGAFLRASKAFPQPCAGNHAG